MSASPRGSTRDVRVLCFAGDTRDEPREGRRACLPQSARRMSSLKENNSFVSGSGGVRVYRYKIMLTKKIKKISGNLLMNVIEAVNYFGVCVLPGINQYLKKTRKYIPVSS